MSASSFSELGSKSSATMFIVCKFLDNVTEQTVSTTNRNDFNFSITGTTVQYNIGMAGGIGTDTISSVDKNFHIHTILYDSSLLSNSNRLRYFRDQTQQTLNFGTTTVGSTTNSLSSILYIAQSQSGIQLFNGYIGEIIIFDRILTFDDQTSVENYLRQKWGL